MDKDSDYGSKTWYDLDQQALVSEAPPQPQAPPV